MKSPFDAVIDGIGKQFEQLLTQPSTNHDIKKSTRLIIQSAFARLDLVSREEFDTQAAVLAKTREKLDLLEAKLNN